MKKKRIQRTKKSRGWRYIFFIEEKRKEEGRIVSSNKPTAFLWHVSQQFFQQYSGKGNFDTKMLCIHFIYFSNNSSGQGSRWSNPVILFYHVLSLVYDKIGLGQSFFYLFLNLDKYLRSTCRASHNFITKIISFNTWYKPK